MLLSVFFFRNSLQFKKVSLPLQPQTRNNGAIAQLVEQRTENPCVPRSIRGGTTLIIRELLTKVALFYYLYPPTIPHDLAESSTKSSTRISYERNS